MFICTHCGEISAHNFKRPTNGVVWCLGRQTSNGWTIDSVHLTLAAAQSAMRIDQGLRTGIVVVEHQERSRARSKVTNATSA